MLKVMIADDEIRVCRLIQMLVDWDAMNMKLIGTAANGLEALELVERLHPDILITDIRMPGCDGLELIERIRLLDTQMEIIIISGYAEFEYAQTAIWRGVGGYLLKPIKKEALLAALEKLGERVRERKHSETTMETLRVDDKKRKALLRERFLEDLIHKRTDVLISEDLYEEYGFLAGQGLFQIFAMKIDNGFKGLDESNLCIVKEKAEEILTAGIVPVCGNAVLSFHRSLLFGLVQYEEKNRKELRHRLRECLNQLEAQKTFFGSVEFTLAIGTAVSEAARLPQSIQEARNAISERLVEGTGRLLEPVLPSSRFHARQLLDKYNRLTDHAVELLSTEEADKAVEELALLVREMPDVRGFELLELVQHAARLFVIHMNLEQEAELLQDFVEQCEQCSREGQLFECLRKFQARQIAWKQEQQQNEAIRPIRLAKQYVRQHYMESITLEDICAAIGFSVSYFSTMFKKETGEGFSKYLTRVRMEQAKMLLQDTDYPVTEICGMVGYNDLKHFTGNFKKITGLNPGQYRKLYG